jgi:hydroxymethylbilane synthase
VADELRLGTRGSQLALWQAHTVARCIVEQGGPPCRIVVIRTSGDRLQDAALSEAGGKRLFVKEIEDALLRHDVDLAVHSSKDMPVVLPEGLVIGAVLPREDPLDAVILPHTIVPSGIEELVAALGQAPRIGTSSVRRIAQLTRLLPGARFEPIRGNLDTRLRKLDEAPGSARAYDAIVLAAAGLRRLGFAERISMTLPADACVPAPGQGIVAVEVRSGDERTAAAVARITDPRAAAELDAERAVIETLGGGCQTPVGALAQVASRKSEVGSRKSEVGSRKSEVGSQSEVDSASEMLELVAVVVSLDGSRAVRARARGEAANAVLIGKAVGAQLLAEGAGDILAEAEHARTTGLVQPPVSSE